MSFTRVASEFGNPPTIMARIGRTGQIVVWGVLHAALLFGETAAELAAPFLLLAGAVWYALPQGLAAITLDGPANDMLQMVRARVPHTILMGDSYISAGTLIYDGILCIAVVAICRTLSTAITTLLLDRR